MVTYKCIYCNLASTNNKSDYEKHLKTKKHFENKLKYCETNNICGYCEKNLKNKSLYNRHNCDSKKQYITNVEKIITQNNVETQNIEKQINTKVYNDMTGNNNTFIIFPNHYTGEKFIYAEQLLSENILPIDHYECKAIFNNHLNSIVENDLANLLTKIDKYRNDINESVLNEIDINGLNNLSDDNKNKIKDCMKLFKELDAFMIENVQTIDFNIENDFSNSIFPQVDRFETLVFRLNSNVGKYSKFVNFHKDIIYNHNNKILKSFMNKIISYAIDLSLIHI